VPQAIRVALECVTVPAAQLGGGLVDCKNRATPAPTYVCSSLAARPRSERGGGIDQRLCARGQRQRRCGVWAHYVESGSPPGEMSHFGPQWRRRRAT